VDIGVLEEDLFPVFSIPKKIGTITAVTNFRKLKLLLKLKLSPIFHSKY
jgi:hypothetical protein